METTNYIRHSLIKKMYPTNKEEIAVELNNNDLYTTLDSITTDTNGIHGEFTKVRDESNLQP